MAAAGVGWPDWPILINQSSVTQSTVVLDGTTDDCSGVTVATEAATVTHVLVPQAVLTGTPGTARIGLQSVNTSGAPSGTWLAGGNGYVDYNSWSAGNDGLYFVVALGTSVTLARGDRYAVVIDPQAVGTWDGSNKVAINSHLTGNERVLRSPTVYANAARVAGAIQHRFAVRSASKTYGFCVNYGAYTTIHSGTTPDEVGMRFQAPAGICASYTVRGIWVSAAFTAARTFDLLLYDTDASTVLQSISIDTDVVQTPLGLHYFAFDEVSLSSLTPGSNYIVSLLPTNASATLSLEYGDLLAAGDISAFVDSTIAYWAERTNAGAWTYTDTRLPLIRLDIAEMTSGGGGGLSAPKVGPGALVR